MALAYPRRAARELPCEGRVEGRKRTKPVLNDRSHHLAVALDGKLCGRRRKWSHEGARVEFGQGRRVCALLSLNLGRSSARSLRLA